jgi:hypothetical protein
MLRVHLIPALGSKPLDTIATEEVQRLKHGPRLHKPKSVNNGLTVLNPLLKNAVDWKVIHDLPCVIYGTFCTHLAMLIGGFLRQLNRLRRALLMPIRPASAFS